MLPAIGSCRPSRKPHGRSTTKVTEHALESVVEALLRQRLCAQCLARRTSLPVIRIDVALRNLVRSAVAVLESEECHACGQITSVYRVGGPSVGEGHPP